MLAHIIKVLKRARSYFKIYTFVYLLKYVLYYLLYHYSIYKDDNYKYDTIELVQIIKTCDSYLNTHINLLSDSLSINQ